mgnify:CR=1 FL=1
MEIPATSIAAGRAFREQCGPERPVWIAGSTHEGEEEASLAAHARVLEQHPGALLPRDILQSHIKEFPA